ncbi:HindVP family restriction endonuclease [Corynebacterium pyruviciproducens]
MVEKRSKSSREKAGHELKEEGKPLSFLFGMDRSNHDFTSPGSMGKNIFTNAFPLAMIQYLSINLQLDIPVIRAYQTVNGDVSTTHMMTPWRKIIGVEPSLARFNFETVYDGYNRYTHNGANKSDVVVANEAKHTRPFEIKLVVVPTSSTAKKSREKQSCEIVTRPSTVEQIAFSIANSFGVENRLKMLDIINDALGHPHDYRWSDASFMSTRVNAFREAAVNLIRAGIQVQTPLVITAVWRTKGQSPELDDDAFDAFVWTDMAFLQLFIDAAKPSRKEGSVSRPSRALMWLISCLYEFASQGTFNFARTKDSMSFGFQTDKAGAFAGNAPLKYLASQEFFHPRLSRYSIEDIIAEEAFDELLPERRLDQAIALQYLTRKAESRGYAAGFRDAQESAHHGSPDFSYPAQKLSLNIDYERKQSDKGEKFN